MELKKRVLIIVYYWPPLAGSGVQRWLKMSKYFHEFGITPVIVTPENPQFDITDITLLKDVHPTVEVLRFPIVEPYRLAKAIFGDKSGNSGKVKEAKKEGLMSRLMFWLRTHLFIPDPRILWVKPTVRRLEKYLEEQPVDAIITSGPPHSMHLIGRNLKRNGIQVKWVADFRDPMSQLDFYIAFGFKGASLRKLQKIESSILEEADVVTGTSFSMPDLLENFDRDKYVTVTNGFDEEDFLDIDSMESDENTIFHAGLLNHVRNPTHLWEALNEIVQEKQYHNLKLVLAGTIDQTIIDEINSYTFLKEKTEFIGYISHEEVIHWYQKSTLNLMCINNTDNAKVNIPGKLFELLACRKPILCFGEKMADAAKIVEEINAGRVLMYDEGKAEIKASIDHLLKKEELVLVEKIEKFKRKNLTKQFLQIIYSIL